MIQHGVPAPAFVKRIGRIVDARRGVEFQDLAAASLLNRLSGSGMPFGWTVNPFRGCEVGCRYCYARSTHEYLGHTVPSDFEERIYVKTADLGRLRRDLPRPGAAPAEVRDRIERLVEVLARDAGFTARSREARVRDEAPARPRQLSLVW